MKFIAIATVCLLLLSGVKGNLQAATQTWTGTSSPSDSNWSDGTNWSGGAAPGALTGSTSGSGTTSGSTTDNAIFSNASSNSTITIDKSGQSIVDVLIGGSAGSYTIGSNGGNALFLYNGIIAAGPVTSFNGSTVAAFTGSNLTETIAAPIVIENTGGTFSSASLYNTSSNGTGAGSATVLVTGQISGTVTAVASLNFATLSLRGANTNANTISGLVSNNPGVATGGGTVVNVVKNDVGTWNLTNNNNSFSGQVVIVNGTLGASSVANQGVVSAIGTGSANAQHQTFSEVNDYIIAFGNGTSAQYATFDYTGTTSQSTNRPIMFNDNATSYDEIEVASSTGTLGITGVVNSLSSSFSTNLKLVGPGTGAFTGGFGTNMVSTSVTASNGSWSLGGSTTYNLGQITTSGTGTVSVLAGSTLNDTYNTVGSGSTFKGAGTVSGSVSILSGGHLQVGADTTTTGTTFALNGNTGGSAALGLTTVSGSNLQFVLGPGLTSTILALTAGENSLASGMTFTLNGTGYSNGLYSNIITGVAAGDFTAGSIATELSSWTFTNAGTTGSFSFNSSTDDISLNLTSGGTESTNYYFTGAASSDFTVAGNYNDAITAGNVHSAALSSTSDVFLTANSATHTPATIGANAVTIDSLTFNGNAAGSSLNGSAGGVLTLMSSGTALADTATGGTTETVNAAVALGNNQTWSVSNSTNTLADTGGISGSGKSLTLSGPGSFNFTNGSSSYSGGTLVNSGAKLFVNNTTGSSALGSGALTVQKGATFGGKGNASGLASFAIGSGGTGTTQVQVGAGGSDTSTSLTLAATGASTITSTNLTFNLNAQTNTGSTAGNQLNLGGTAVTFSGDTLTLNLTGAGIIAPNTPYVLMTDSNGFASSGLGLVNGLVTTNLSFASNAYFGTGSYYAGSYLFVSGDNLEVEVVPEPSTWALMIGGLAVLFFWQRQRNV